MNEQSFPLSRNVIDRTTLLDQKDRSIPKDHRDYGWLFQQLYFVWCATSCRVQGTKREGSANSRASLSLHNAQCIGHIMCITNEHAHSWDPCKFKFLWSLCHRLFLQQHGGVTFSIYTLWIERHFWTTNRSLLVVMNLLSNGYRSDQGLFDLVNSLWLRSYHNTCALRFPIHREATTLAWWLSHHSCLGRYSSAWIYFLYWPYRI
jgi:hypothetical protein